MGGTICAAEVPDPAARGLTLDDPGAQAKEPEFLEQRVVLERYPAPPPPVEAASGSSPLSARHIAYRQRQEQRKVARKPGGREAADFLSGVPEVQADVQYRFTLVVLGDSADQAVAVACRSGAARSLPRASPDKDEEEEEAAATLAAAAGAPEARSAPSLPSRCLCRLALPLLDGAGAAGGDGANAEANRANWAKLAFRSVPAGQQPPACANHLEALNTTVVFFIAVDRGLAHFRERLQYLAWTVEQMRARSRAKLRPVRAIILCTGGGSAGAGESWANTLVDFEQTYGQLWKFGPIGLHDGNAFHATFAEIASTRIAQQVLPRTSKDGSDGAGAGQAPDEDSGGEEADLPEQEQGQDGDGLTLGTQLPGRRPSHSDETSSQCSEGWHRPPVFETEWDGSECSERALEMHQRVFHEAAGLRNL